MAQAWQSDELLAQPFVFRRGGVRTLNRIVKGALSENLADPSTNLPNEALCLLYQRWAAGGVGISITGNVMVDGRYLEAPGNVVLDHVDQVEHFRPWADAIHGPTRSTLAIMQISHPGRQCPVSVTTQPVGPSALTVDMGFGPLNWLLMRKPRTLTELEIEEIIARFARTAVMAESAGFDGVQIHAAHGYLLSQFLSPKSNHRRDKWGGSAANRRRLLFEIIHAVRRATHPGFLVGIKINSQDFLVGGTTEAEIVDLLSRLANDHEEEDASSGFDVVSEGDSSDGDAPDAASIVDFVEISGGTYENFKAFQEAPNVRESTQIREGFFMQFAELVHKHIGDKLPLIVTGGFRSARGMNAALASGATTFIGLGRPLCVEPGLPLRLVSDRDAKAVQYRLHIGLGILNKVLRPGVCNLWHCAQLHRLAHHKDADLGMSTLWCYLHLIPRYIWEPRRSRALSSLFRHPIALKGLLFFALTLALFVIKRWGWVV